MRTALLSLLLLMSVAAPAIAQEKTKLSAAEKAKAKQLYDTGLRHYNVAEYPEAIAVWKQAYLISKKPLLLFNIGQAYRLSGDCKQAMTFYGNYQREDAEPSNQADLDQALVLCAPKPATPDDKPAPAQVLDKPADKAPLTDKPLTDTSVASNPPVDKPIVTDKPVTNPVVTAQPTDTSTGNVDDQPPPPEGQSRGGGKRTAGLVIGAAGVVLGGVGIGFGIASRSINGELDDHTGEWTTVQADQEAASQRDKTLAWVFGGLGAAAAITGVVLVVVGGPSTNDSVAITPTRDGAAFVWGGRF